MNLDVIRFQRNWTSSYNFHEQIEALEISQERVQRLKGDHERRMKRILNTFFRYHWIHIAKSLLAGTDVHLPTSMDKIEMEISMLRQKHGMQDAMLKMKVGGSGNGSEMRMDDI